MIPRHPQHAWAKAEKDAAESLAISAHTLAETYKVVSAHPQILMPLPSVQQLLSRLSAQLQVVTLDASDYEAAVARCVAHNLPGGAIYDTLIAQAALKVNAVKLVTLNPRDFKRLGGDVAGRVVCP